MLRCSRVFRNKEFGAIVVGGGVSGCLVAGRLATENINTLLVESGSDIRKRPEWHRHLPASQIVHRVSKQGYEKADTTTVPQTTLSGEKAPVWIPTPHVLGGHGVMGSRSWNLGDAGDWDGAPWDFREELIPRVRTFERMAVFAPHRGKRGKFLISPPANFTPYFKPFCEAVSQDVSMISEFTKPDFRASQSCGRPDIFVDLETGKAHSTLQRYVLDTQSLKRPLSVLCDATAVGITGASKTEAEGVTVRLTDGSLQEYKAPIIVVCSGTIGSAQLLSSSRGSIQVEESVGTQFWDVPQVVLQFHTKDRSSHNCYLDPLVRQFIKADLRFGKPLLSLLSSYDDLLAYWSEKASSAPQVTILFQPFTLNNDGTSPIPGEHGCQFIIRPFRPKSRGSISADGSLDPRYFSEAKDLEAVQQGVRYVKEVLVKKKPFIPIIGDLIGERLESSGINGGSCSTVIDPVTFQVKGTDSLYLCDGSIIPNSLSGSTLPYKLALADKFVDKLLKKKDVRRKVEQENAEEGSTRIVY